MRLTQFEYFHQRRSLKHIWLQGVVVEMNGRILLSITIICVIILVDISIVPQKMFDL
jgi:hypothetical protein